MNISQYLNQLPPEVIEQGRFSGFPWLRFLGPLETAYSDYWLQRMNKVVPLITLCGIVLYLVYCFLDYFVLPERVYSLTIVVRITYVFVLAVILFVIKYKKLTYTSFLTYLTAAYVLAGISIVAIIMSGHWQGVFLPYDGMLMVLLAGYLLMGLPFLVTAITSWSIIGIYLMAESLSNYPVEGLVYNSVFLVTANVLGCFGHYLNERRDRSRFLNMLRLSLAQYKAEQDSENKTKLIAAASHDIRQPLHAMNLLAEHLLHKQVHEEEQLIATKLQSSIHQLNHLLSSVLDISRLNVGAIKVNKTSVDLGKLIDVMVDELKPKAKLKQVVIEVSGRSPVWVETDYVLIRRVIRNILDNALEHSHASVVRINWLSAFNNVRLIVSDNGIGIPECEQEAVFKPFHKVKDMEKEGMGLGLAIVKQMAKLLGHSLSLKTAEQKGTTFWLDMPRLEKKEVVGSVCHTESVPKMPISMVGGVQQKTRILFVDDQEDIVTAMQPLLKGWGFDVRTAMYPREALSLLKDFTPDLVISDYSFTGMENGLWLIETIRQRLEAQVPAMLLTADMDLNEAELSDILLARKPIQPAKLRLMIQHLTLSKLD